MEFASFTLFDWMVTIFVVLVALVALSMGFVKFVLWIGSWVGAFFVTYIGHAWALGHIKQWVDGNLLASVLSYAGVFILALLVFTVITQIISSFIEDSAFGSVDKVLGGVGGFCVATALVAMAFGFFEKQHDGDLPSWVAESQTPPYLQEALVIIDQLRAESEAAEDLINRARQIGQEGAEKLEQNINNQLNPLSNNN